MKNVDWGIAGLFAAIVPSLIALSFAFLPEGSQSWSLIIAAVLIGLVCMAFTLLASVIAHAKNVKGQSWSLLGVCLLPFPFVILVIVNMLAK